MACHLFVTKPSSEPVLAYYELDHLEQSALESKKTIIMIQENAFQNVVSKNDTILSR